jgi:TonB family protein
MRTLKITGVFFFLLLLPTLACKPGSPAKPPAVPLGEVPEFGDSANSFTQYLQRNMRYPQKEKDKGIQGTVYISFVVEADGSVSNVKAEKEVPGAPGLTAEALRVVRDMPRWRPARTGRMPVTQPIKFVLK